MLQVLILYLCGNMVLSASFQWYNVCIKVNNFCQISYWRLFRLPFWNLNSLLTIVVFFFICTCFLLSTIFIYTFLTTNVSEVDILQKSKKGVLIYYSLKRMKTVAIVTGRLFSPVFHWRNFYCLAIFFKVALVLENVFGYESVHLIVCWFECSW